MPDPYTTPADLRVEWPILADEDKHTDEQLERLVERFESIAEHARGVAYRERTATETLTLNVAGPLLLSRPEVSAVTAIEYSSGTAPSTEDITVVNGRTAYLADDENFPAGVRITVTYGHGFDEPPPGILDACGEFVRAKRLAASSNQPRNTLSYQDPDSSYVIRESTADWAAGRYTGLMVVDDAINAEVDYRLPGIA